MNQYTFIKNQFLIGFLFNLFEKIAIATIMKSKRSKDNKWLDTSAQYFN